MWRSGDETSSQSRSPMFIVAEPKRASGLELEMEGFRAAEGFQAQPRQRAAPPGVFHPGPGKRGIEVVAAVHVQRAGLDLLPQRDRRIRVLRPHRCGKPVAAVVHEADCFLVAIDPHDAYRRTESLSGHDAHAV